MSVIKEFKEFISRGNVVDMAVGVVVGGAFTKIVTAFTTYILTPVISCLTGKVDISNLSLIVSPELIIPYGMFLQSVVDFLLTAAAVFVFVKAVNSFRTKMEKLHAQHDTEEQPPEEEEQKPTSEELLAEIRDLLKKENQ